MYENYLVSVRVKLLLSLVGMVIVLYMKAVRCMSSVGCVVDVGVHEEIDGREINSLLVVPCVDLFLSFVLTFFCHILNSITCFVYHT